MSEYQNKLGQPIGFPVADWQGCEHPRGAVMQGRRCRLEPIDVDRHASDLFAAFSQDRDQGNWTYLPYGPFNAEARSTVPLDVIPDSIPAPPTSN